jgi:hypothetical protein
MLFVAGIRTAKVSRIPAKTGKCASIIRIQVPISEPSNGIRLPDGPRDVESRFCLVVYLVDMSAAETRVSNYGIYGGQCGRVLSEYLSSIVLVSFHECSKVISI